MENLKTMAKVRLTMIVYRWNIAFNNAVLRLRIFRIKIIVSRVIDTGAGYLIKSVEKKAKQRRFYKEKEQDEEYCQDCNLTFKNSHLRDTYDVLVCDGCNDKDKYPLITKSDAKSEYLITDTIFNIHNLKFEMRKNPHNAGWGEMKLFLLSQVEAVALKKWESWENLEKEKEKRKIRSADIKQKQFDKKLAKLRYETRIVLRHYRAASQVIPYN